MMTVRSVLIMLFAVLACHTTAAAQLPPAPPAPTSLVGSYEITQMDGTPVSPGNTATADVSVQGGVLTGVIKLNGVTILAETMTFELVNANPLLYIWTNVRGSSGFIGWNAANQRFESIVVTGNHAGTMRAFCPR